jgi:hypothetical protein
LAIALPLPSIAAVPVRTRVSTWSESVQEDARVHLVRARVHAFEYAVACIVNEVGVVAGHTVHRIGPGTAIDNVACGIPLQMVVEGVAVASAASVPTQARGLRCCCPSVWENAA